MKSATKPRSQRQLQVGEEIRHILSNAFMRGDFYEPLMQGISVTVSEVRVSPDLKNATVYIMPLGGKNSEKTMEAMKKLSNQLRSLVSKNMGLRISPRLSFSLDDTFEVASKMNELLKRPEILRDLEKTEEP